MTDEQPTASIAPAETDRSGPARVWNRDFALLWQGQLVSSMGDIFYAIALGFWILQTTGSTALMGGLMAASALPRVLVAPFAGVVVDRVDRKKLLVAMDIIRGAAVVFVGAAALLHLIRVWMVFAAGIVIGFGGAFFSPGVTAIVPSIVPRARLIQANSSYALIATGSGMLGNPVGGVLFQVLGAPLMFLFNGLSYLVSSLTLLFVRVPRLKPPERKLHFLADIREGLRFVWRLTGLRALFLTAGVLNFFGVAGITLILPLFQRTPGLGPARYGLAMACLTGGLFLGFASSSAFKFPPAVRFRVFMGSGFLSAISAVLFSLARPFPLMLGLVFLSGVGNAVLNSFIMASIQTVTPPDKIGKVSALLMTLSGGLVPLSMAAAGGLAEAFPIRILMAGCFGMYILLIIPLLFSGSFERFINFDPLTQSVESLMR
jgi:DHA3 family macrolide efflux protein-like MFS transporter